MSKIPIDSIVIPDRFVDLCIGWYDGVNDKLYAVASTGGLSLGNIRPQGCDSDEKWYLTIWRDLAVGVYQARRAAGDDQCFPPDGHEDLEVLIEFEEWVDEQVDQLSASYGLEEWEP